MQADDPRPENHLSRLSSLVGNVLEVNKQAAHHKTFIRLTMTVQMPL